MVFMLMWIDEGYFEQLFRKKPNFNIKFGVKPIFAQNSSFNMFVSKQILRENIGKKNLRKKKF